MIIEQVFPSGAWLVSDIIDGHRVKKQYLGYSKREALQEFKEEFYGTEIPQN